MSKELTPAARAAKMIREQLKSTGLTVTVKSRNYSMGCAVDVTIYDQPPDVVALVQQLCGKFQYGHFDAMTDMYESSNVNRDLPQAKTVHVRNEISDERREAVYQFLRGAFHGWDQMPETYKEGQWRSVPNWGFGADEVHRQISQPDSLYWRHVKEQKRKAA